MVEDAENLNSQLIALLLENPYIKREFFCEVNGVTVFDKEKLEWVLDSKSFMPDSYTRYESRIGLADWEGKFIRDKNDVELVWPYKDCVLEGGQDKEDEKRNEVFYNETLAPDEVTRLLDKKVFCNAIRYTSGGGKPAEKLEVDDNLIIKGNNLLVLSSLAQSDMAGKVKCIYIDPPYNTGHDSFNYNDKFNRSSWLTFMKNRLDQARILLADNGVMLVQLDDHEQAYLKVLMDQIFTEKNFVSTVVIKGGSGRQDSTYFAKTHEFILVYAKNIDHFILNEQYDKVDESEYNEIDENGRRYKTQLLRKWGSHDRREDRPNLYFPVMFENEVFVPVRGDGSDGRWRWQLPRIKEAIQNGEIVAKKTSKNKKELYQKIYFDGNVRKEKTYTSIIENLLDDSFSGKGTREIKALFADKIFSSPKSEIELKKLLDMVTQKGDIVLDFFLGSGTTAAVAHKMGRRYIGIEQMDYVQTVTIPRLQKVIGGEQGGISKDVGWQGGGSFVYCELKELASSFLDRIGAAEDDRTLDDIYRELLHSSYLSWRANEKILSPDDPEYQMLSLEEKKKLLCKSVDKNKLYVNNRDRNDEEMHVTAEEKVFTDSFYHRKEGDR